LLPGSGALSLLQGSVLAAYVLAQLLLVFYSSHRYLILWRWWRGHDRGRASAVEAGDTDRRWPTVTIQLPVFNEPRVIERLIDAVARLDYPRDRLEIQVLDDSTDETTGRARRAVERHRSSGLDIHLLHRACRSGFKAGALTAGLARARGELLAVFDADFVPSAGFLRRMVPTFDDPEVGMVQARWGHLNRGRSALTAAQAVMLDAHFLLEHSARMAHGLFFNFNGTAGVWRRRCLEDAGGWSNDTLTEDLDLSYRAQLRGWRFRFDARVEAPGELPIEMEALKSQQRRWTKGAIQTARKLLPRIFAADLPRRVKLEAFLHLTSNSAYPLLLALGLLLLPVLLSAPTAPAWQVWVVQTGVMLFGIVPVVIFLIAGQRLAGRGAIAAARDILGALVLGVGLSLNNSRAVIEGLGPRVGAWERTPKTGDLDRHPARGRDRPPRRAGIPETVLALYFGGVAWFAWRNHDPGAIPFMLLMLVGFGGVAQASRRTPGPAVGPRAGS
jgi:cellulose synthase/poly-beta-1,6-N-acetylglucosamine synthase-like glycosyltransferase